MRPYRPAVVIVPPRIVTYGYPIAPVYYPPPPPAFAPAYYAPRVYYGPSIDIGAHAERHGYAHGHGLY